MRGLKSTIALLVVLIGLGAYVYFVTWKQPDSSEATKLEKVFPDLAADKIDEMRLKSGSGDVTTVKKDAKGWQITQPIDARASESTTSGITMTLGNMEISRVIDENPANIKEYGLESPNVEIDFKGPDAKATGKIAIGEKTPTGAAFYAKRNDEKRVFLIQSFAEAELNRSTFDTRDKAIVSLQRDKVDGAEVMIAGKPPIEFKKTGLNEWKLNKPVAAKADLSLVDSLIARVETAQMKSIVTENATPADLKKYGLDKPEVTVTVLMGTDRSTLIVGGKTEDGNYAKDPARPAVMIVEGTLVNDLTKDASEYRPKSAFDSRSYNVTHIDITRGSQNLVLDLVKGKGENAADTWHRLKPTPGDADKAKVDALLTALGEVNVTSYVESSAKTGLSMPSLVVDAKYDEGAKEEKVTFGQNGNDIFVSRPGDPDVGKVDADHYNDALKKLDELLK